MKIATMLFVLCCLISFYAEAQEHTLSLEYTVNLGPGMCNYYGRSAILFYYNDISEYNPQSLSIPAGTIVRVYDINPAIPAPPVSVGGFSECTGDSEPYNGPISEDYEPDLGPILFSHLFDIIMDRDKNIEFIFHVSSFNCSHPSPLPALKGDVNNDSYIDIIDALLTAQYYVGIKMDPAQFNPMAVDVNCDDVSDIIDALLIAQYYVGIILEFPCP